MMKQCTQRTAAFRYEIIDCVAIIYRTEWPPINYNKSLWLRTLILNQHHLQINEGVHIVNFLKRAPATSLLF